MSTPESNKITLNAVYSGSAIRRSLLTPCRRIGLSKNRQPNKNNSFVSPLQNKAPILIDTISLSPVNQNTNEATNENISTTPIVHNKYKHSYEEIKHSEKLNEDKSSPSLDLIKEHNSKIKRKQRRRISYDSQQEKRKDNERTSEDKSVKIIEKDGSLNPIIELKDVESSRNETTDTNLPKSAVNKADENYLNQTNKKAKICAYIKSVDDGNIHSDHDYALKSESNSLINTVCNESQCNFHEVRENFKEENILDSKIISHRLDDDKCKKKDDNVDGEQASGANLQKEIHTKETTLNNILDKETGNMKTIENVKVKERSNKSFKRKLSLKKSSLTLNLSESDETSITINKQDNIKIFTHQESSEMIDEIIKLEVLVKNKEDELHRLQQAQIYRNIHKIDDVQSETDVWRNGCQEALRDLLMKLNEHNVISMDGLLLKLNAPPHLISYDSDNDCFYNKI